MGPKPSQPQTAELFRPRLDEQINMKHPLLRLATLIDWAEIERTFAVSFTCGRGRPALSPRLIAGLLYLQHTFDASDEAVVNTWVENPYWQFFCGETYLQTEAPIDPSSLTRWRQRVGEEGVEALLAASIDAARRGGVIQKASVQQVIVDTTVMPKAIAHPTDSRLLDRSRQHLVKAAEDNGLRLRQNYNRVAPRLAAQIGRYAHAKQFKRMKKAVRTLRTRVGRVHREVQRQLHELPEAGRARVQDLLQRTGRILAQRTKDKNKLYALHAPEVECISKGKARTPYEFGVKVSIATTLKEGLVVGMRSMPGNPYDGHTLAETLEQVGILTGTDRPPATAIVDKGYQGVQIDGVRILRSGQKRGMTKTLKAMIKRRSAIEPAIGHMKMDGRLARNPLKGALGDALHAVMCGAGHNLRLILAALRLYCARIGLSVQAVVAALIAHSLNNRTAYG
ncbi:IS5 family transposase [Pseudacidovorax intermedius]|uniref:Transposase n=3 Tax=Pseudacidovorax TaxID=433923 RepID=A0A147H6Z7_9BURK|nr:IS5 family transposase [Pseudacidovorax intermedius]KTT25688.1 transposase [Pseudacidovorax intermedius]